MSPLFRPRLFLFLVVVLIAAAAPVWAERPSTMKLFPEETLVFVRMADAHEFGQRLNETATGRMLRDPQLKPLVEQLYGDLGKIYAEKAEEKVGVSWDDLQKLPHGEVAFAIVARPEKLPAFLLLVDQGDQPSVAERLLDRALELAEQKGGEFTTEKIGDVEVTVVRDADNQDRMLGVFERENTIVAATDADVLRGLLWHWDGGISKDATGDQGDEAETSEPSETPADEEASEFVPGRTLAENDRFATIMQNSRRPQDPPPQLIFFADPVEIVRNFGRENAGVQFAMGVLPALGVDGLMGVGGTLTFATDQYDDLSHFHVLLENPRSGVLQVPAFESGDTTPQPFVPHAVESYTAFHWNVRASYDRVVALVDQFRSKGATEKIVKERLSDPLGIDFRAQVIDNLAGRFSWMVGYDTPAHFRGQQHIIAAELKDETAAAETLTTVIGKFPDLFEERHFGDVTYYSIMPERLREMEEEDRPAEPFVAILDGFVFLGGSCRQFERCVEARDGTVDRLADSDDYARTSEVVGRETAGTTPAMFSMSRYEETVRQWYDLATSERTRELIDEHKEDNQFLSAVADALDQNELPPFEALAPYLAPSGAILYDTDTGYHAIGFTLRNETE